MFSLSLVEITALRDALPLVALPLDTNGNADETEEGGMDGDLAHDSTLDLLS